MESMQSIKGRIASIGSTRQITQSMWLLSSAKMSRTRTKFEDSRPFAQGAGALLWEVLQGFSGTHPALSGSEDLPVAVIVLSSDRGLCGGYNINVGKQLSAFLEGRQQARIITVGQKIREYCLRRKIPVERAYTGISENPLYDDVGELCGLALDWYLSGEVGGIHLISTELVSLLQQTPRTELLLPLERTVKEGENRAPIQCEPEQEVFLDSLLPVYLTGRVYSAILEAAVCELSARIIGMDAASKNSDEILASLTLLYNQARQGAITQEITEIVGGAEALSGSDSDFMARS